ncbi:hypothetical protein GGX14DRAFT_701412 [Mycena pura]|uniref:Uncharacterized protein n=1 Tax=Mycena pura TaxID=153505 RepID=A0AAD6UQG9_9AGAR|nr:hypothetical protein GGX14DRAFT_701412 [Mycena pura]
MARAVVYAAATWELGLHVTASLSYYHTSAASASLRCARRTSLNDWERLWAPPYWVVIVTHTVRPFQKFSSPRVHGFASHCAHQQLERAVWDARVLLKSTPENAATCYLLSAPAQGDDAYAARPWAVVYPVHVRVLAPARRPLLGRGTAWSRTSVLVMQHDQLMLVGSEPPPLQAIPAALWMSRRPCPGSHVPRHCARTAARRDGCWRPCARRAALGGGGVRTVPHAHRAASRAGCWTAWIRRLGAALAAGRADAGAVWARRDAPRARLRAGHGARDGSSSSGRRPDGAYSIRTKETTICSRGRGQSEIADGRSGAGRGGGEGLDAAADLVAASTDLLLVLYVVKNGNI